MKIGIFPRTPTSAISFYRGIGPLGEMRKSNPDIEFTVLTELSWAICKELDLLFVARPNTQNDLAILNIAKRNKLPIVMDWDDDPFTVPVGNPAYQHHQKSTDVMKDCLKLADHVICSTIEVERAVKGFCPNTTIIPNAFDNTLFDLPTQHTKRRRNIVWRGGSTHRDDVMEHQDAIVAAAKGNPDWLFTFIGDTFGAFEGISNIQFVEFTELMYYIDLLHRMEPAIVVVPLKENNFNKAKSNIAWIEATYAGATTLAPSWSEAWDKPGIMRYKDKKDFGFKLNQLIKDATLYPAAWTASAEYIRNNLMLTDLNKERYRVIKEVYNGRDISKNKVS